MTNKIIIIVLLIACIITLSLGVCYADYSSTSILPSIVNNNVQNIDVYNVYDTPTIDNLKSNGYQSIFSRYSAPYCKVVINISEIAFKFNYVPSIANSASWYYFNQYVQNLNNNFSFNYVGATNIDDSSLSVRYVAYNEISQYSVVFQINGVLSFNLRLDNTSLLSENGLQSSDLFGASFGSNLLTSKFTIDGYTLTLATIYDYGSGSYDYNIQYSFDRLLTNVNGFITGEYASFYNSGSELYSLSFSNDNFNVVINNETETISPLNPVSSDCVVVNMLENSSVSSISYDVKKISSIQSISLSVNNAFDIGYIFNVYSPLIYNKVENFIPGSDNITNTPLKLQYYDCKHSKSEYITKSTKLS